MKQRRVETIAVATSVLWAITMTSIVIMMAITVTGCDEGMNMVNPVLPGPGEEPTVNPGNDKGQTTNGEVKNTGNDNKDPGQQDPKDPETPPEPTVTIDTAVQADDNSVTISGTSTDLPEGAKVTIVLGDGTITMKTAVDKDGAWSMTVSAKKAAKLAVGTVAIKATAKKATAESSFEIAPPPEPTLTIDTAVQADDGSVSVSGTSTNLPEGEVVTITIGDAVTVTATTDSTGAWSVTVPTKEAASLVVGTVAVRAIAGEAATESMLEHTPTYEYGIVPATEAERIMLDIITDVAGKGFFSESGYNNIIAEYGSLFDVETDVGRATFRRFVEYDYKSGKLAISGNFNSQDLKQYYGEAYGFSYDFAVSLVHDIYLEEIPEDKKLLSVRWQVHGIGMEYLLLQIANPDATEEELLELLRESIRAGNVSIAA